jgi:hypothetical protein
LWQGARHGELTSFDGEGLAEGKRTNRHSALGFNPDSGLNWPPDSEFPMNIDFVTM